MSMWTDRELKALKVRVDQLEKFVHDALGVHPVTAGELKIPQPEPHVDKRTREYRESVGR